MEPRKLVIDSETVLLNVSLLIGWGAELIQLWASKFFKGFPLFSRVLMSDGFIPIQMSDKVILDS